MWGPNLLRGMIRCNDTIIILTHKKISKKCNIMSFQPLLRTSFHPYYRLTSVPIGMEPRPYYRSASVPIGMEPLPYRDAETTF